ncbi:MAG: diguanylate cyclase, partial [Fibrobacterota bacterium]|nr:GGDEF domain-containing protein [Chitinispirillaceae bacterium]
LTITNLIGISNLLLYNSTMANSKPYTIAFLADNFHSEYCHIMYSGLKSAVSELGVSLITVGGGNLNNPQFKDFRRNRAFDLINTDDFDGIIIQSGSLNNFITEEQFQVFCSRFEAIPTVHIGFKKIGYSSIVADNKTGMRELVDHFIEEHHRKDIAFIRGPINSSDADERYQAYRDSLQAHGIAYREDLVFTGIFLSESGTAAVKEFMDVRKVSFDALVGANDQMALFAMNELLRRGKKVPGNVIIGGFDSLISARACSPALTSVGQPVFDLGKGALELLINIIEGKAAPGTTITLPSRLVLRRSCGCISVPFKASDVNDAVIAENTLFEKYFVNLVNTDQSSVVDYLENQIQSLLKDGNELDEVLCSVGYILNTHAQEFSPDLQNKIWQMLLTISEEHFEIRQLKRQEEEDQLYNFIDDLRKLSEPHSLREFLHAKLIDLGIKEFIVSRYDDNNNSALFYNNSSDKYGTVFRSNQLLPNGISSLQKPFNLICLPLFETDSDIGFFLTNPTDHIPVFLETIRSSLNGALQMMDMIAKEREHGILLEKMVQERTSELQNALKELSLANVKLEQISVRDELTGLLNRRGFLSTASRHIALSRRNMSNFICIFFDLDKLKLINDTYGHAQGDIAIKAMAEILTKSFRITDVIGRMGGDEFTVLAVDCSEQYYEQITKRMNLQVEEYNTIQKKPWKLDYSSGMVASRHEENFDIDTLLKLADLALYKVKEEKSKNSD